MFPEKQTRDESVTTLCSKPLVDAASGPLGPLPSWLLPPPTTPKPSPPGHLEDPIFLCHVLVGRGQELYIPLRPEASQKQGLHLFQVED